MPSNESPALTSQAEWSVELLRERLESGEPLFLLDVRNREEFASGRVEGRVPPPTLNVPYFEILEGGGSDDMLEAVKNYARRELATRLPKDRTIVTICAKGGTSAIVAEGLRGEGYRAVNVAGGTKAWNELYVSTLAFHSSDRRIWQVIRPARGCLSYVVASDTDACVIDPLRHVDRYLDLARAHGLQIRLVLDTHAHADHLSGGLALARTAGVPYCLHPYDAIHPLDVLPATIPYEPLADGWFFRFGFSRLKALHVPGHTLGNMAFLLDDDVLFSGDSIFVASIARPDLGGRAETWTPLHYRSLRRLLQLPDSTLILPAHASSGAEGDVRGIFGATLKDLIRKNEGVKKAMGTEEDFRSYILSSLPVFPPQYVDIKRANLGLITPDEEKAVELETGRNVCALESLKQK